MKHIALLLTLTALVMSVCSSARAEEKPLIRSTVVDVNGKPVQGAYIFFYDSPDTKRAVDLVSPVTDRNGYCEKAIPPGSYWILARLKREGDFDMGPLMVEDKLSDPLEIEVKHGDKLDLTFTVMDLLDTVRTKTKKREDLNLVTGRVVDDEGKPVKKVFVFANRHNKPVLMPRYFSAWTGEDGRYAIYLPEGKYFLGISADFAPDLKYAATSEIMVRGDMDDQDLVSAPAPASTEKK